jgi:hypothetical protein
MVQHRWFVAWGWVYRPVSWQGIVLVFLVGLFCIQVFVALDRHSHSASDTLYGMVPYVASCLMLLNWVASKTARAERRDSSLGAVLVQTGAELGDARVVACHGDASAFRFQSR